MNRNDRFDRLLHTSSAIDCECVDRDAWSKTRVAAKPSPKIKPRIDCSCGYSPKEVSKLLPGNPHSSTIWRWWRHGVTRHGKKVRLKVQFIGGRVIIWGSDLLAFLEDTTSEPKAAPSLTQTGTDAQEALSELAKEYGIG